MSNGGNNKPKSSSSFHFLAGLSSGVSTAVLLQPADLLKTRVQQSQASTLGLALREILNGPRPIQSLWRGTVPSVIRTGAGSALYFGCLNSMRVWVAQNQSSLSLPVSAPPSDSNTKTTTETGLATNAPPTTTAASNNKTTTSSLPKLSNTANLLTGALARASAGIIMSPVTVLKVRYESSYYNYTSLYSAAKDILIHDGPRGFFAGFGATAVRDAPYAGLYVLFYEKSKERLGSLAGGVVAVGAGDREGGGTATVTDKGSGWGKRLFASSTSVNFVSGIVAAVAATAVTNPFDAIKTRLQLMPGRYGNMVRAARMMVAEEGVRSLFNGLTLRMARKALSSALAWTVYEELIRRAEARIV